MSGRVEENGIKQRHESRWLESKRGEVVLDERDDDIDYLLLFIGELAVLPLLVSGSRSEVFQSLRGLQERARAISDEFAKGSKYEQD